MPQAAAAGAEVPVPAAAPAPSSSCRPSAAPIPHNVNLRPACVADTAAAAAMFAAAFEEDPEIQYIYKGVKPHQYKPAVQMLYSKCTRMFFCRKGCPSWCAVDAATQELIGAASITPLKAYPGLLTYATHGLLLGRQWPSLSCLRRMWQTSDASEAAEEHPHLEITAELSFLGVTPAYQGRGVGRQLLQAILAAWDAQQGGPLILYTAQSKALGLYQSQGFEVLEVQEIGGAQLTIWYMHRPQLQA